MCDENLLEKLAVENLWLRGENTQMEAALIAAHELVAAMAHILKCHGEEIASGIVDTEFDGELTTWHPATRARLKTVTDLTDEAEKFLKLAQKPDEWADLVE